MASQGACAVLQFRQLHQGKHVQLTHRNFAASRLFDLGMNSTIAKGFTRHPPTIESLGLRLIPQIHSRSTNIKVPLYPALPVLVSNRPRKLSVPTPIQVFRPRSTSTRQFSSSTTANLQTSKTRKMKLPYVDPSTPVFASGEPAAIIERVRARRAPRPLQALDLTLLHSPNVADGWNSFLGAIRTKTSLPDDIREIAICRVAVVNEAWYEWGHHAPLAKAGGVSDEGIKVLGSSEAKNEGDVLTKKQWAVVKYTDAMTRDVKVPEPIFAELKNHFSEQEVVEITATVAAYNCVSRFLVALDVGEKNSITGPEL